MTNSPEAQFPFFYSRIVYWAFNYDATAPTESSERRCGECGRDSKD